MIVRPFDRDADIDGMFACVVELQDFERRIDPRMPAGNDIAAQYVSAMLARCGESDGRVYVAADDSEIAGYVTVLAKVRSGEIDDGDLEYAYLADLMVREAFRGRGTGRELMAVAESYARERGARWLRLSALAANQHARQFYAATGFSELYVDFEKDLDREPADR